MMCSLALEVMLAYNCTIGRKLVAGQAAILE